MFIGVCVCILGKWLGVDDDGVDKDGVDEDGVYDGCLVGVDDGGV